MYEIINEINLENGSNYKIDVLKKYKDNELLQRILKMAYDKVQYTYGISMKNVEYTPETQHIPEAENDVVYTLEYCLSILENKFCTREYTGNLSNIALKNILERLSKNDAKIIEGIINRDLRINMGRTNINKVFKNLIVKPVYMRCDIYSDKTAKHINFKNGAYIQKKADGTYREFTVTNGEVSCVTRSGESHEYPKINEHMKNWPDRIFTGELTVWLDKDLLDRILPKLIKSDKKNSTADAQDLIDKFEKNPEGFILPRSIGNGLINSDDVPHDNLVLDLWDCITHEEYSLAGLKDKKKPCTIPYEERLEELVSIVENTDSDMINVIENHEVFTLQEALKITSDWMNEGFEGGVLKDKSMIFENRTSKKQLKLKLEIDLEVRCTGFTEGKKGTKREKTFGAMMFKTDDMKIQGRCSGFSDKDLEEINKDREKYVDRVFTVRFNDLTKAEGHDYYALSHPRFIEFRDDKDETDTLERAFKLRDMAMQLGNKG